MRGMRQQSAIEYLMTYGWAILVIVVVLAILFTLNIFNSGTFTPTSCEQHPGFLCSNLLLNTSGYLSVSVGRDGAQINATGVACTLNNTAPASSAFTTIPTAQMLDGFTYQFLFQCPLPKAAIGSCLSGVLWLEYTQQGQSGLISEVGAVNICARTSGVVTTSVTTTTSTTTTSTTTTVLSPPCVQAETFGLDSSASAQWSSTASGAVTLSTASPNDIIVVIVADENPSAVEKVTSISSANLPSGSWHERSNLTQYTTYPSYSSYTDMEVWWAYAPNKLSSETITATLSGSIDDGAIIAFGVSGANTTAPWDTNAGLPNAVIGNSLTPSVTVSTTARNTIILGIDSTGSYTALTPGAGYTQIQYVANNGATYYEYAIAEYAMATSPQTGIAVDVTASASNPWFMVGDAIRATC